MLQLPLSRTIEAVAPLWAAGPQDVKATAHSLAGLVLTPPVWSTRPRAALQNAAWAA